MDKLGTIRLDTGHLVVRVTRHDTGAGPYYLGWTISGALMEGRGHADPRLCDWRGVDRLFRCG